jgi:hypothetical protein
MEFIGGLVGIRQDPHTLRLRPEIGWAVREAPVVREVPARVTRENVGRIVPGMALSEVRELLGDGTVVRKGDRAERRAGGGLARITTAVLEWREGDRRTTVTFENDQVVDKHHTGLG